MESSMRLWAGDADAEIPDFSPFSQFMIRTLQATQREGLVITTESFMEFKGGK